MASRRGWIIVGAKSPPPHTSPKPFPILTFELALQWPTASLLLQQSVRAPAGQHTRHSTPGAAPPGLAKLPSRCQVPDLAAESW